MPAHGREYTAAGMTTNPDRPGARGAPAEQDTEVRFRTLFEQAPFSVQLIGPDGRTRRVNRAWEKLWVEPGDTTVLAYVLGEYNLLEDPRLEANGVVACLHRALAGESVEVPPVFFDPSVTGHPGPARWVKAQLHPVRDDAGQVIEVMLIHEDVSEQVRVERVRTEGEQRLRQTEERLRLATLAGSIGIWEWDVASDRVTWSDEVYGLHELPPGSFGGHASDFAALVHAEDRERLWLQIGAAIRERDGFSAEFRILLPDGRHKWLSTWARAHEGSDPSAVRLVGAVMSIDSHKQAEAALHDNARRKDEFLAMLAHELRNPLAAISTASQVLQLGPEHAHQIKRASGVIDRQIRHITSLVDDLLDVSRVTRGLAQLARDDVDLALVIAHAAEQALPAIEARRHTLVTHTAPDAAHVVGDATRLVQAVANLLSNAAKYTPPGGEIGLALEVDGALARIRVSDNGTGIEPALLPQIFDLFTQGERTPGRVEGGLGIGLALVRSIAELHGGEVRAESAGQGRGSCFTLSLPLRRQVGGATAARTPAMADSSAASTPPARHVMIVDDNRDAADVLAVVLQSAGHRAVVRHSADAALAALDEPGADPPDIFILDIGLPGIDGYELARRLRPRRPAARLIALTGYGQPEDREQALAAGFDHHLVKPVRPSTLFDLLAHA